MLITLLIKGIACNGLVIFCFVLVMCNLGPVLCFLYRLVNEFTNNVLFESIQKGNYDMCIGPLASGR